MVHGRSRRDEWHEPSPVDVHTIAGPKEGSTLRDSVQLSQHILLLLISPQDGDHPSGFVKKIVLWLY